MAHIEIIMYVALGFATAALIALLLGRLVWTLAVGVGRRRAQRTATTPAVAELQAERNQLRAEYAMLARRVEVRLDDLKRQVAEQMAEVSRSRNRMDRLGAEIEARNATIAERDGEIARLKEQVAALVGEAEARSATVGELQEQNRQDEEALAMLGQQLADRDQHIEALRAEVERLSLARSEAVSRERSVQERLKGRIEDLTDLSRQIEAQRRQLVVQQSQSQALREAMAEQRQPEDLAAVSDDSDWDSAGTEDQAVPAEPAGSTDGDEGHNVPLERRVEDAERQASELQGELDRLDEIWAAKLADVARAVSSEPAPSGPAEGVQPALPEPGDGDAAVVNGSASKPVGPHGGAAVEQSANEPGPAQDDGKDDGKDEGKVASGLANVISLAQRRIRALQRNGS